MKHAVLALLLFAFWLASSGADAATRNDWSETVNGLQARLVFGKGDVAHGVRRPEVYLELHNTTNVVTPMEFEFDGRKSLQFELHNAEGKPVAGETSKSASGFMLGILPIALPRDGALRFPVTWSGWGINTKACTMLGFQTDVWGIVKGDLGDYFLSATLTIPEAPRLAGKGRSWYGILKIPAIKAPTKP